MLLLAGLLAIACGADAPPTADSTPPVAKTPPPAVTVLAPAATVAPERLPLAVQLAPVETLINRARQLSERDLPTAQPSDFLQNNVDSIELSEEEAREYVGYVPPRLSFVRGALYRAPVPEWISITYSGGIHELLLVEENPFGAKQLAPIEFTDLITVNGERAYLVRGWPFSAPRDGVREWFWDESGLRALFFRSGDKVFAIWSWGDRLTTEELVRMAESIS